MKFFPKRDPTRERERLIQFLSTALAVGIIFLLRVVLGNVNWAILAGIAVYFIAGVMLERRIPLPPKDEDVPKDEDCRDQK